MAVKSSSRGEGEVTSQTESGRGAAGGEAGKAGSRTKKGKGQRQAVSDTKGETKEGKRKGDEEELVRHTLPTVPDTLRPIVAWMRLDGRLNDGFLFFVGLRILCLLAAFPGWTAVQVTGALELMDLSEVQFLLDSLVAAGLLFRRRRERGDGGCIGNERGRHDPAASAAGGIGGSSERGGLKGGPVFEYFAPPFSEAFAGGRRG
uniref:Uncharacterized protein n=1 Tax=Chromera velia CCMP2878 TaxID=1169474 RepID=A0A0G4HDB7_9ALVE|eukprot:Cvel_26471.t1-p1 / transcript=Cvel_26471.t1 / gene=Cvel_26471 / organism=Chromera_velia_CCMP2878 / gene_product=hypothetical protein / transcript_product=hypothetical protein / location=Cvel_scaffold3151:15122-16607(+) / protein_length=203 / sequence_SO=supercontig / SO=protein_coding / is_pseudo=false